MNDPARAAAPPSGETSKASGRGTWVAGALLFVLLSLCIRLPILWDAAAGFNSDEAAEALFIQHLLAGRDLAIYYWDVTYHGIVQGLFAIPFVLLFGPSAAAFKLAPLVSFLMMAAATVGLALALWGRRAAVVAAALLVVFSPQLVWWSMLATSEYLLVVAWGTLAVWRLHLGVEGRARDALAFGFLLAFGLYLHEIFALYVLPLVAVAVVASRPWAALRPPGTSRSAALRAAARGSLIAAAAGGLGFLLGLTPKLWVLIGRRAGSKRPLYALADSSSMVANARLLLARCAPALIGANPAGLPDVAGWTGAVYPGAVAVGWLLVFIYATAWFATAWSLRHDVARVLTLRPVTRPGELALVAIVPSFGAAFVTSPNAIDLLSDRYLLAWVPSLTLLAAALIVRLGRSWRPAGAVLLALLILAPTAQTVLWLRDFGYVDARFWPRRRPDDLPAVVQYLRERRVFGAYAPYWVAYKATFLSRERPIVAPLFDWDRYPAYSREVDADARVAYVFNAGERSSSRLQLEVWLTQYAKAYEVETIGAYEVIHGPRFERLHAPRRGPAVALLDPRAEITFLAPVGPAVAGGVLVVPVRLTNRSGQLWSASGIGLGIYRVGVSYRWLGAHGARLSSEGERTLLPQDVAADESVEVAARVVVPAAPGRYKLLITLVQETVGWFDDATGSRARTAVDVLAPPSP